MLSSLKRKSSMVVSVRCLRGTTGKTVKQGFCVHNGIVPKRRLKGRKTVFEERWLNSIEKPTWSFEGSWEELCFGSIAILTLLARKFKGRILKLYVGWASTLPGNDGLHTKSSLTNKARSALPSQFTATIQITMGSPWSPLSPFAPWRHGSLSILIIQSV